MLFKKFFKSKSNVSKPNPQSNAYLEKINKVLHSLEVLFEPFKTILIKTVPFSKPFLRLLDFIFFYIAQFIRFIAKNWHVFLSLIKSKFTVALIFLLVLVFLSGALITRYINTFQYVKQIEEAVYNATGYNISIRGKIKFNTIPFSLELINSGFILKDFSAINNKNIYLYSAQIESIVIHFKILPLLLGNVVIDKVSLVQPILTYVVADINNKANTKVINYSNKIASINLQNNSLSLENTVLQEPIAVEQPTETSAVNSNFIVNEVKENSKVLDSFLEKTINNISNNLSKTNKILSSKGKIIVLDSNQSKLFVFENISTTHNRSFLGTHKFEGNFRYNNTLLFYNVINESDRYVLKFSGLDEINEANQNYLEVVLNKEDNLNNFSGHIEGYNLETLNIVNLFGLDPNVFTKNITASLKAQIDFKNNILQLSNIDFNYDSLTYKGNIFWEFSKESLIDINLSVDNFKISSKDNIVKLNNKNAKFINTINVVQAINQAIINNTKASWVALNLNFNNIYIENIVFTNLNFHSIVNPQREFYLDNLSLSNNQEELKLKGKFNLEDKTGRALLEVAGFNNYLDSSFANLILSSNFVNVIFTKPNLPYNLKSRLVFDNNKIIFNEVSGSIDTLSVNNTFFTFLDRISTYEASLNLNIDNINLENLYSLYLNYANQTVNLIAQSNGSLDNGYLLKILVSSKDPYYKGLIFKDLNLEMDINKTSLSLKKFNLNSTSQGLLNFGFSLDFKSLPMFSGSVLFENFLLDFAYLKDIAFSNFDIVGNMVLNGRLKLTAKSFNQLDVIDGDINFIKQERLKLNKFNLEKGLYLTISNNNKDKKYFINDIYGSLKIIENKIDFYPVFFVFLQDKKEYRGNFIGNYDILSDNLKISGSVDSLENTNNKISFDLTDKLYLPVVQSKEIKIKQNNKAKILVSEEDILKKNAKSHSAVNNLNNEKDKEHFNNNYNSSNKQEDAKNQIDSVFKQSLEESSQ